MRLLFNLLEDSTFWCIFRNVGKADFLNAPLPFGDFGLQLCNFSLHLLQFQTRLMQPQSKRNIASQ